MNAQSILRRLSAFGLLAGGLFVASCSVVSNSSIEGSGLGTTCKVSDDCHAGFCDRGLCVASCSADAECPAPTRCFAGKCERPLKVTAIYVGVVADGEGWTVTHHDGLNEAVSKTPYVTWNDPSRPEKRFDFKEAIVGPPTDTVIDDAVKAGADVIIANSDSHGDNLVAKAKQYPNVKFLGAASFVEGPNLGSFTARSEQGWYIAGVVGAKKTKTKRLGIVGSFINPESIRHINAYTLGARSIDPAIKVQVSWLGFWYDYRNTPSETYTPEGGSPVMLYREELLAQRLVDDGCDVVAHLADNQRAVRYIDKLAREGKATDVWSLTNDNRYAYRDLATQQPLQTSLGGAYWNWTTIYSKLFDEIHRGTWKPSALYIEPMTDDPVTSPVGFELSPIADSIGIDSASIRSISAQLVQRGHQAVFQGPYATTGQRDKDLDGVYDGDTSVGPGELLTEAEWTHMCWYVDGVIERRGGVDRPAKVPDVEATDAATPPDNMVERDVLPPPGVPSGTRPGLNCRANR